MLWDEIQALLATVFHMIYIKHSVQRENEDKTKKRKGEKEKLGQQLYLNPQS